MSNTDPNKPLSSAQPLSDGDPLLSAYKQMMLSIFSSAILFILLFLFTFSGSIFSSQSQDDAPSPVLVCVLAGAMGAIFSSLIRIYNFSDLPQALVHKGLKGLKNLYLMIYSLIPIVVGATAAVVLYVIVSAQIIEGPLFAKFICKKTDGCPNFADLINFWSPAAAVDYAKMIVWGFIAGFAERLVPNAMDKLSGSVVATLSDRGPVSP